MDYSLRRTSFNNKSSHGSSSSFKNRHHNISISASHDSNNLSNYSTDEDESAILAKKLAQNFPHHHENDVGASFSTSYPMNMNSSIDGEVIVKIEPSMMEMQDESIRRNNNIGLRTNNNTTLCKEFSFPRPIDDKEGGGKEEGEEDGRRFNNVKSVRSQKQGHCGTGTDPTSKLIGKFLEQEKEKEKMTLDMDMEMDELQPRQLQSGHGQCGLPPLPPDHSSWSRNQSEIQSPDRTSSHQYKIITPNNSTHNHNNDPCKEPRVSFHESLTSELVRRPSSMYSNIQDDSSSCTSSMSGDEDHNNNNMEHNHSAEMLRCPSNRTPNNNTSYRRMPSICLSKTKSRLIDPAPATPVEQRSGVMRKSGQLNTRSGLLGKSSMLDDDEDDPFLEDDFPDEFRSVKTSTLMILEWVSLIIIMGALICSLVIPILRKKTLWKMKLWKWEVLILVLICGRLVSDWGIRILVFFIERNFLLRKRVLYFVYGLKKAVQNVIWLGLVLLTWYFLFDKKVLLESRSEPLRIVTKLLIIGEVGAILWLLKTLLVKVLASNFHVKAFFDRIQESLFNQFVIETLSAPPLFEFQQAQEEEERTMAEVQSLQNAGVSVPLDLRAAVFAPTKSGRTTPHHHHHNGNGNGNGKNYKSPIGQSTRYSEPPSKKHDEGITIDRLHKLNQKNVSAWNMKRLMRIIRHGALTTLDEQIVDSTTHIEDETGTHIRSEVEAKAAARKIFRNVAKPHSRYIYLEDIMRFMREDEAIKTMGLFEGAIENERINKKSLKNWVVNAFRERRALALTLSDTKTAVNKLHKMVNVLVSIIIVLIGFIYLKIITSQNLLFFSSQIVVVAFVFGNTCKNIFESIIFLFVIHPYDVGDRCEIDSVQMVVEEINILTTVFLRYDNQKIVFPNYILLTKPIHNYYRSPDMGDGIELCFHIATPAEKIAVIRQRITSYIDNKKEHWYPSPMIILKDTDGLHMLRLAVWLQHRMNHQDMGERWTRRALLIEECIKIFREMDIEYRVYPMNVNVTSIPPLHYAHHAPPPPWNAPPSYEHGKEVAHT
ncbi:mechanosensitive ion channel protein 6 [Beta vulgaris subsp. vulgaris]|uniref:mechanosensitive ion channel protein 6 n=1 Tax=Beta vulgaris subsp. vulgaris TaxID=3555 RepID=UPI0020368C55|nr:mechanosensitive ion channel protein 6 [Beta vulgaris subsp. vulgaris]